VHQPLSHDLLRDPRIPRAPLAPRLNIELVDGMLRIYDPVDTPDPISSVRPRLQPLAKSKRVRRVPWPVTVMAITLGFVLGLGLALLSSLV
jgi:hypothetical protein